MKKMIIITLINLAILAYAAEKPEVLIFYKNKKPSQQVLTEVDSLLQNYETSYSIIRYDIEDEQNAEIINRLGLPQAHFPFAVVIEGKYSAEISGRNIAFVHFPIFMHGIGRHEGNWSLIDLKLVLEKSYLLADENLLPIMGESSSTSDCDDD